MQFVDKKYTLEKDGFILCKNIFSENDIKKFRNIVETIYNGPNKSPGDNDYIKWNIFNNHRSLRPLLFNKFIINLLKKITGDNFVLLNDMSMLKSSYKGWHKDTSNLAFSGATFHHEKNFLLLNVIIYLQENTETLGGGLDVIPGSHLENFDELVTPLPANGKKNILYYIKRIKPKLKTIYLHIFEKYFKIKIDTKKNIKYSIPTKIGDVIIFDQRISHKASWPKNASLNPDKFLINYTVSRDNEYAVKFMDFLKERKDFLHLKKPQLSQEFCKEISDHKINTCF